MKFIIAPNAFKGSLSATQAALAIETGIKNVLPDAEICRILISDGGDGFIDALQIGMSADIHQATVRGPIGKQVTAKFLYSPDKQIAIIEMAAAAGLALLKKNELDPLHASTFGVGELLKAAMDLGAKRIVLGIGGSATNDGGTGMATALGIRFLDQHGQELVGNAANLSKICKIDFEKKDPRLKDIIIDVACDVNNPLLGQQGAATIYGPQKGASKEQQAIIESGLEVLARVIKHDLNIDVTTLAGGGAAGGLGAGLVAFFDATLKPGAELLLDIMQFDKQIQNASLLITTEGKLDYQTGFGKAPSIVAKRAASFGVPCIAIVGQVDGDDIDWHSFGFNRVYSLSNENVTIESAIKNAAALLIEKTYEAITDFI